MRRDRAKVQFFVNGVRLDANYAVNVFVKSVQMSFSEPCPTCGGAGVVQSKGTTINLIERWIGGFKTEKMNCRLELRVHPAIAEFLSQGTISRLTKIQIKFFVKVKLQSDPSLPADEFHFILCVSKKILRILLQIIYRRFYVKIFLSIRPI